jgi:ribose 5-phosphate isomerase B
LREQVLAAVASLGHELVDVGATTYLGQDDYPDYAEQLAQAILSGNADRGILICGSGVGICIAANKFAGIRAAICHDTYSARQGVEDDAMNVLCLGGRVIGPELAGEIIRAFLAAEYKALDRYERRKQKVEAFEQAMTAPKTGAARR